MRGISSAMWSSVSGLQGYGAQLGTIGTNIANSGSIGYRGTTTYLTGGFSGHLAALSGAETMAQGVAVSSVYTNFASGVGLSTTSSRHMAISGTGMFGVRQPNSEEILFTRRGDFEFNVDGYLSTPEGYRVQGWPIDSNLQTAKSNGQMSSSSIKGTGQPTDIRSPGDTSPPKATTVVEIVNNLGASDEAGKSSHQDHPYFGLMSKWNGRANPPLGEDTYSYQNTLKVYDENGGVHEVTVYFDKVDDVNSSGEQWEFIVTIPPNEDKRTFNGVAASGTAVSGLLMSGVLDFSTSGQLNNMLAFVPNNNVNPANLLNANDMDASLANWGTAPIGVNGYPMFFPNFSGKQNPTADGIELNFGIRSKDNGWVDDTITADALGTNNWSGQQGLQDPAKGSNATTNYAGTSSTLFLNRDGNSFGVLQDISVDKNGIMSALYSNGAKIEFAQVALYSFADLQGLEYLNGSIYRATKASGFGTPGAAGDGGRGDIQSFTLEQSNVDLSTELTNMIVAQNSYTACTKMIQTSNQALAAVINMV